MNNNYNNIEKQAEYQKHDSYYKPNQRHKIQRMFLVFFLYSALISNIIITAIYFMVFLVDHEGMMKSNSGIYSTLFELIMMLIVSCVLFKLVRINSTIKLKKCWAFTILISFLFNLICMPINILVFHRKTWDYIYCK